MSEGFTGRAPDFSVSALDKTTGTKGKIGVAWKQPDGSVRIKLNSFVSLPEPLDNLIITCWPETGTKPPARKPKEDGMKRSRYQDPDSLNDSTPF